MREKPVAVWANNAVKLSARRPGHPSSAQDVQVDVIDSLATIVAGIDDEPVALIQVLFPGDVGGFQHQIPQYFRVALIGVLYGGNVLFRDYQYMGWSRGADIMKGTYLVVFVDLVSGYVPCDNFAEQAIV